MKSFAVLVFLFEFVALSCLGQIDSIYIKSYQGDFMGRVFVARRFANFNVTNRGEDVNVRYSPGNGFAIGLGANYKWATLNFSYAFDFLNPYRDRKSDRSIDLQLHGYGQKILLDFRGQFYKGFYSTSDRIKDKFPGDYIRPDISVDAIGGSVQYVFNNKQFSYRATFLQNQWQRKSAGTLLAGMEIYVGRVSGDSALIPPDITDKIIDVKHFEFIDFGPNVGYAYTWVYKGNFYLSGSATVSLNAGYTRYTGSGEREISVTVSPNTLFRMSAGYAVKQWSFNLLYITAGLYLFGLNDNQILLNSGDLRATANYRFSPSRRLKKYLKPVDRAAEKIETILDGESPKD